MSAAAPISAASASPHVPILPTPGNPTPPVIRQAPSEILFGRNFRIVSPDADRVVKVGLLSVGGGGGSLSLGIVDRFGEVLVVAAPDPGATAPGPYLLFIYANGPDGLIPSLPALLTLSAPPSPPPSSGHSPASGGTSGSQPGGRSSEESRSNAAGTSVRDASVRATPRPSAALASPAAAQRPLGTGVWVGVALLVVFVATFLALRRMLRA